MTTEEFSAEVEEQLKYAKMQASVAYQFKFIEVFILKPVAVILALLWFAGVI